MNRGHTPYGYRIENGCAVICAKEAEQIRKMYEGYLRGLSLIAAAKEAGFQLQHSSAKRIMQNPRYLGDGFYPAIIERETFDAFEAERVRRETLLGRDGREKKKVEAAPAATAFRMRKGTQVFSDPYRQAEYLYSMIESEV